MGGNFYRCMLLLTLIAALIVSLQRVASLLEELRKGNTMSAVALISYTVLSAGTFILLLYDFEGKAFKAAMF
jgi:hypothetical protein